MKKHLLFLALSLTAFSLNLFAQNTSEDSFPPPLSVEAIIEVFNDLGEYEGIVLIHRGKNPIGKALPGGSMQQGESVEQAVRREMKEEVHLDIYELRQFHVYSSRSPDSKWYTVEIVYLAKAYDTPTAGDDATEAFVVDLNKIPWNELVFDDAQILKDYLSYRENNHDIPILNP